MTTKIITGGTIGIDGYKIIVEIDISNGMPSFDIVGLPDSSIKESKERVRAALKNIGYEIPPRKITINLAPAYTKKEGAYFDLPIAVGILVNMGKISKVETESVFFAGELSLDGYIRPLNGLLPMVHYCAKNGIRNFVVPYENYKEASLISGTNIIPVSHLNDLINNFDTTTAQETPTYESYEKDLYIDFSDVKGQENVIRALTVAAAGGHNILMIGPPGSGKTMMAKRIPYILPDLNIEESITTTKIYSVAGQLRDRNNLIKKRPFRAPHHTISYSALVGGGVRTIKPGEISLSHNGILFLDELPEFNRNVLEAMRQPIEDGYINIARANGNVSYPSSFMLVASMNPCPCGNYSIEDKCTCSQGEISKYLHKISSPLLDRIDIHIEVGRMKYESFKTKKVNNNSSKFIKQKIVETRKIQVTRYGVNKLNSTMDNSDIDKYCKLSQESDEILKQAFNTFGLSARAYHKILKMARTIADMDNKENIEIMHLTEAIQYRSLDRKYFTYN